MTPRIGRRTLLGAGLATAALGSLGLEAACADQPTPTPSGSAGRCAVDVHHQLRQLRGMWIASVVNIDWPSKPGLTAAAQQAELVALLDVAASNRHNAVVLQVRPTADAFFPSMLEPWSKYLTGVQGQDPGYDPLAFAVEQAHARGMELHAWFNPYRITMNLTTDVAGLVADHPAKLHPEWTIAYGGKLYFNPGVPEARAHCVAAMMQAVTGHDIDAVHFDDYFYPYPVAGQVFDDAAQFAQYGAGRSLADWRRDNINQLIRDMNAAIKATKPGVKFGVSPFAVWANQASNPLGSATQAGSQTYSDLYADTRRWVQEQWIDYIAPQVYWADSLAVASYGVVTRWWADVARASRTHLYIGEATYKVGASTQSPEWNTDPAELSRHLQIDAETGRVDGNLWYNASAVRADALGATSLVRRTWYERPALVPTMPWLHGQGTPKAPKQLHATRAGGGVRIDLQAGDDRTWQYAIFRLPRTTGRVKADDCRLADASSLVALVVVTGRRQAWVDTSAAAGERYTYVVTGVDRLWNQSTPQQVDLR